MTAALAGLGAGALHALSGPDHLLGVAPHVAARRAGAWRVGAAWGAGHALGTAAASAALLAAAAAVHLPGVERWAERGAGLALVLVGLLGILDLRRARLAPAGSPPRRRGVLAALGIGVVHGLLGAPALAVLVAGASAAGVERALFLAGFSAGGIVAMAALAEVVARAVHAPSLAALLPRVPIVAGAASVGLGLAWIAAA
jgi:hypothetical protein